MAEEVSLTCWDKYYIKQTLMNYVAIFNTLWPTIGTIKITLASKAGLGCL